MESFENKIENVQYKTCSAITGAIQEISRDCWYQELGLESLEGRLWYQKLTFFDKIVNGLAPEYLTNYLNVKTNLSFNIRASEQTNIKRFAIRTALVNGTN